MMQESTKHKVLLSLSLAGFILAALAGLADHVTWLQSLCTGFSDGCKDTAAFTLFRLPVWLVGIGFYGLMMLFLYCAKAWLSWLVAGAVGAELALVWTMFSLKIVCVFCLGNVLVVLLLIIFSFERSRFWQTLSVGLLVFLFFTFLIPHENESPRAFNPAKQEQGEVVLARVGDEMITKEELERPLAFAIHKLEEDIYRLKKQRLDQMISERLLEKEANQRGISVEELVNNSILADGVDAGEEEVDRYYQENRARLAEWKGSQEELRQRIKTYLQQQKSYQKVQDYTASMNAKYGVTVYLKEPESPVAQVKTEGSAVLGPADAPVTIVEFSDYQCPACRGAHEVVRRLRSTYAGQIRWIFKDFPLKKHTDAQVAAEAARCAGEQEKFWEYQDVLYASKEQDLPLDRLEQYAGQIGLATDAFKQCLGSRKYKDEVEREVREATQVGVDRTPTFLINGKMVTGGLAFERFKELIDQELARAAKKQ